MDERRSRSELEEKQKWMGGGAEVNERKSKSKWEEEQK